MDKVAVLRQVKRVEEEVRARKQEAQEEARSILTEARSEADRILETAREEADESFDQELEEARSGIEEEVQAIVQEGEDRADEIRSSASGDRLEEAVDLLMERFETTITGE